MATSNTPFGLKYHSGPIQLMVVDITTSYGTAIYKGDCVACVTAGTYERHAIGYAIAGVAWAFIRSDGMMASYVPATDTTYTYKAIINVHPDTLYICQEDGDTTALALTDMGNNANLIYTETANTATGVSAMEINSDSQSASTTTLDVHLYGLADWIEPDGSKTTFGTLANAKYLVKLHNMQGGNLSTGI